MGEVQNEWASEPELPVRTSKPARQPIERRPPFATQSRVGRESGLDQVSTRGWIFIGAMVALVILFILVLAGGDAASDSTTDCQWRTTDKPEEDLDPIQVGENELDVRASGEEINIWRQVPNGWELCTITVGGG
jgi:hypothetical protein